MCASNGAKHSHVLSIVISFASFVVVERESKAKHLQTVAGVQPTAYWLATLLWDSINYTIPATIIGTAHASCDDWPFLGTPKLTSALLIGFSCYFQK